MKAVLMGWELGGGLGHLMRLRPVAKALLEAGHRAFSPRGTGRPRGRSPNCAWRIPPSPSRVVKTERGVPEPTTTHTLADVLARQGFDDAKALFAAAERWHLLLEKIKPDLVISDFSPTLNLVARGRPPLVVIGNGFTVRRI